MPKSSGGGGKGNSSSKRSGKGKIDPKKIIAAVDTRTLWERELRINERGKEDGTPYKQSFGNVQIILTHHLLWRGLWAYDEFIGDVVTTRPAQWDLNQPPPEGLAKNNEWTEQDTLRLRGWLDREYGIDCGASTLGQALRVVAEERRVHVVRAHLEALIWDGVPRIDNWLVRIGGAEDSPYTKAISAKFLIGAVARVFEPGCKNDCMVVFEGPQGAMKSTMVEVLAGDWYSGTPIKMGTKDGYQSLRRKWILEIPELSHFDRSEMNEIKAFLSQREDNYRPSYGVKNIDFLRQSLLVGTTNDRDWHRDVTGGRRFWPVYLHGVIPGRPRRVDIKTLRRERDQLWAEAVVRYKKGEKWFLETPSLLRAAAAQIEHRRQIDPWEEPILKWLKRQDSERGVSTADILTRALQIPVERRTKLEEMRVGGILRSLGWERKDCGASTAGTRDRYLYRPVDLEAWEARIEEDMTTNSRVSGTPAKNGNTAERMTNVIPFSKK